MRQQWWLCLAVCLAASTVVAQERRLLDISIPLGGSSTTDGSTPTAITTTPTDTTVNTPSTTPTDSSTGGTPSTTSTPTPSQSSMSSQTATSTTPSSSATTSTQKSNNTKTTTSTDNKSMSSHSSTTATSSTAPSSTSVQSSVASNNIVAIVVPTVIFGLLLIGGGLWALCWRTRRPSKKFKNRLASDFNDPAASTAYPAEDYTYAHHAPGYAPEMSSVEPQWYRGNHQDPYAAGAMPSYDNYDYNSAYGTPAYPGNKPEDFGGFHKPDAAGSNYVEGMRKPDEGL